MAVPQSNRAVQNLGIQSAAGTDPTASYQLSVDTIGDFGPEITRVARDPLSVYNTREAGSVVDQMATATIDGDAILDHLELLVPGALRCAWSGPAILAPTSVTAAPKYVVPSGGALAAGTLIRVRGCAIDGNNGVKVVAAASDATNLKITTALTAETITADMGVTIEVCGYQGDAADLEIDASQNLKSTTLDFTTLGLVPGQMIWIGGPTTSAATCFATAGNRGLARISGTITAHSIPLENRTAAYSADNGSGKTIWILFGKTARVVPTTHADYIERFHTTEVTHQGLSSGTDAYEYVSDGAIDTLSIKVPQVNKATMSAKMIGSTTVGPTITRKTGFVGTALARQTKRAAVSGSTDVIRGRVRSGSTLLTGYVSSFDLSIANSVTRNTALGVLGAAVITFGKVAVDLACDAYFSSMDVMTALTGNDTVTAELVLRNDDGGIAFDVTAAQLGGGKRSFPTNQVVHINLGVAAVRDPVFNTALIVSRFPYLPDA